MASSAKFTIGQIIHHNLFEYRGVVVDVDATYQKDDRWYDRMARTRPPKDQPWYQILVHDSGSETYVAERNLSEDFSLDPVDNPKLIEYFTTFNNGHYQPRRPIH